MAKRHSVNPPEVDAILDTIDDAMTAQGLTLYRVAKLAEIDEAGLGRVMSRQARPKLETALRIASAVGQKIEIVAK